MNLLIAEDDQILRHWLTQGLENLGHDVTAVSNGQQAITKINSSVFECIITDIYMPEMDGFEVIRHARKTTPDSNVIAISGMVGTFGMNCLSMAMDFGANQTIEKPFTLMQVKEVLEKINKEPK